MSPASRGAQSTSWWCRPQPSGGGLCTARSSADASERKRSSRAARRLGPALARAVLRFYRDFPQIRGSGRRRSRPSGSGF
eukprot:5810792-Prymnesium_polylepis.1